MKYLSALIVTLIFTSACSGFQKVTQDKVIETNASKIVLTEQNKDNNSTKISLGENGSISDDGISVTTEIIYTEAFDHAIFNALLKKYVSENGNVNYKGLKTESKTLQRYIDLLKLHQPNDDWTKNDKLAYWINAYNALTIDLILRNYPTKSIKDIKILGSKALEIW
ncbi:DUF547 domain-containing protein [Winogradskyella sp. PC D3.3]